MKKTPNLPDTDEMESALLANIRALIASARNTIARGVDLVQVNTNFEIGRHIVEFEQQGDQRATYGDALLTLLADGLTAEFGKGFGRSNIAYFRSFYLAYRERLPTVQTPSGRFAPQIGTMPFQIVQTASGQSERPFSLSWSHYVFLLGIKKADERSFYEIESINQNWTLRELRRQFQSGLYERLALSRDQDGIRQLAQQGQIVSRPSDLLKEPLVLEFLGLSEQARFSESDLEAAIINQIEHFLLELGKGFLFEARQKRFTFDDDHFFVDLVFYNRLLRCYVLIDLKIGKLTRKSSAPTSPPNAATALTNRCAWKSTPKPSMAKRCWWCMCPRHNPKTNRSFLRLKACPKAHFGASAAPTSIALMTTWPCSTKAVKRKALTPRW